ncbi:MAG TPA: DEAD/DEAH box helicase [Gemmatimonadaceae bacterium]|nr:DEAD/DEAH box helicase [Gemmatimonadaceae bacterium]
MSRHRETRVVDVAVLRDLIARTMLELPNEGARRMGLITLGPHQEEGAARLLQILRRHGGALLADEVGLGKTYTALAVARNFARVEVVGPAALRAMWNEACERCSVAADYVTTEALSRAQVKSHSAADLVVVDEAHSFRNPATQRYRHLALRCRAARVLLLSATPLHNRPADISALFALFLGARAVRLTPNTLAQLTVRRGRGAIPDGRKPPPVLPTVWWRVRHDASLGAALDAIDPPVPFRDGGVAITLLRLTLHRRMASSHAALRATLRRMLARALALRQSVEAGQHPTEHELRSCLVSDEAIQLALPGFTLAGDTAPNEIPSVQAIARHIASVRAALSALAGIGNTDHRRAAMLGRLMRRYSECRIVAFSQYEATVRALARALRNRASVVALSAKGGVIASGRVSRGEILQQFDATERSKPVGRTMRMQLLLTTDLLSEGVNLHNANIVIHLDLPWTPARLEQRVGRVSRLGSPHRVVHVFGFAPPASIARLERTIARVRAKWRAAHRRFGQTPLLEHDALVRGRVLSGSAHTNARESLLAVLRRWLGNDARAVGAFNTPVVAYAALGDGRLPIALALLRSQSDRRLVAITHAGPSTHPNQILGVAEMLSAADAHPDAKLLAAMSRQVRRYVARERAAGRVAQISAPRAAGFLREVARVVASLPRQQRPRAIKLEGQIRSLTARTCSAGDLRVLQETCDRLAGNTGEALAWLELVRTTLQAALPRRRANLERRWHLAAILIGT